MAGEIFNLDSESGSETSFVTARGIVSDDEEEADWFDSLGDHFGHFFGLSI